MDCFLCPQEELNLYPKLRRLVLYPLSYEGKQRLFYYIKVIKNYLPRRLPKPPGLERGAAPRPKLIVRPYLLKVGLVPACSNSANFVKVNFLFINLSILRISFHWSGVAKEIALP